MVHPHAFFIIIGYPELKYHATEGRVENSPERKIKPVLFGFALVFL
jgi:hypothetical protein